MEQRTLPGRYFTDPAIFREEMELIYCDSWVWIGRAENVANTGEYFVRDVAGESIIMTRDSSAELRALYNVCRHRGTRMCMDAGGMFSGRIQCPYHGWTYSLDGRLLGAPHMDDPTFRLQDYPLRSVHTALWDGHIFVHLGNNPRPLGDQLGDLPGKFRNWRMQDLRLHKRIVYEVNANWKLLILNYNECLHCPLLHPALNRLTDYLAADNESPASGYIGGSMGFRPGAETMSTDGARRREYLPQLTENERKLVAYYAIYPNLLLSLHPDYMMVHSLWPASVDRTKIICEWYFDLTEMSRPNFIADDAIDFWDKTNREDWAISEQSQLGVRSRAYAPGPYSLREGLLHAFDRYILDRIS
jgi:Rieske 2Fe-2S family protein